MKKSLLDSCLNTLSEHFDSLNGFVALKLDEVAVSWRPAWCHHCVVLDHVAKISDKKNIIFFGTTLLYINVKVNWFFRVTWMTDLWSWRWRRNMRRRRRSTRRWNELWSDYGGVEKKYSNSTFSHIMDFIKLCRINFVCWFMILATYVVNFF